MRSLPKVKVDRFPPYHGVQWDRKISKSDDPNYWKYGVANRIFLDHIGGKKLVLDLGCGTGGSTLFLADHTDAEMIIGVDLMRSMAKVARKNAIDRGLDQKICFLVCDGRHLPFKATRFEALISRGDVFCFLVPPKMAVQELKRVMKPGGVVVLEMDNRVDWKPGTIVSTSIQRTPHGKIAYLVEKFTTKRDHRAISYVLDPRGKIAKSVEGDPEFEEKRYKASKYSLQKVREETIEIRKGVPTHWPSAKELFALFKKGGFMEVRVTGDGLLMKLLLEGDETIVKAMKTDPQLFFEIEKRLVPYVDPNRAPTMILRATAP